MDLFYRWFSELVEQFRNSVWEWICEFCVTQNLPEDQNAYVAAVGTVGSVPFAKPMVLVSSATTEFSNDDPVPTVSEFIITKTFFDYNKTETITSESREKNNSYSDEPEAFANWIPNRSYAGFDRDPQGKSVSSFSLNVQNSNIYYTDEPGTSSNMRAATHFFLGSKESRLSSGNQVEPAKSTKRRTRIPDRPIVPLSLWSMLKNFIGMDLSRVPLSVHFFEPLSMLQRISEDFEYSELLDQAAACNNPHEQLAYLAAFTVASYSSTDRRVLKPFNPLLGETFEFDRTEDLGWRIIAEQVSHHPPVSVLYCEGKKWKFIHEWIPSTKLTGNSIVMTPGGSLRIEFLNSGHKFIWNKNTTIARNIIFGSMYLDHSGEAVIRGEEQTTENICYLRYFPYSTFSKSDYRKIQGEIVDKNNMVKWLIQGYWDKKIDIAEVSSSVPWERDKSHAIMSQLSAKTIWTRRFPEPNCETYYNFSIFACELNEEEEKVAPTDSRLRPDQRLMEQTLWTEANEVKARLEQQQREKKDLPHTPVWFLKIEKDGQVTYKYGNEYWDCKQKQNWSRCPKIF